MEINASSAISPSSLTRTSSTSVKEAVRARLEAKSKKGQKPEEKPVGILPLASGTVGPWW